MLSINAELHQNTASSAVQHLHEAAMSSKSVSDNIIKMLMGRLEGLWFKLLSACIALFLSTGNFPPL